MGLALRSGLADEVEAGSGEVHLIHYDAMCRAIAECCRIDEAKDLHDKATAIAAYARQATNLELERQATEIRKRAERRCGELLREMEEKGERHGRGGNQKSKFPDGTLIDRRTVLANLGIKKKQSMRWQKLAAMPEEEFERRVTSPRHQPQPTPKIVGSRTRRAVGTNGVRCLQTLLELAERPQPISVKQIGTPAARFLLDVGPYVPWLSLEVAVKGNGSGSGAHQVFDGTEKWNLTKDQELYEICYGRRPRPALNGESLCSEFKKLSAEVKRRRKANHDEKARKGAALWSPMQVEKAEQTRILDFVETRLDELCALLG
jgi:hypothetical protein